MATMESGVPARPMRDGESVVVWVVVSLLGLACFHAHRPWLERVGWGSYPAYLVPLSIVFLILLAWFVAAHRAEGQPWELQAYLQRNRLQRIRGKTVLWGIGLGAFMLLATAAFSPLGSRAISAGLLPLPAGIPDYLDPSKQQSLALLKDQYAAQGVLAWIPVILILNIVGEGLFWRGMFFPRQELRHGRRTWIVHGLLWCFSHLFQYWLLPPILIGSLALAWTVQRTRTTWVGIVAHQVNNGIPLILMLLIPGCAWVKRIASDTKNSWHHARRSCHPTLAS